MSDGSRRLLMTADAVGGVWRYAIDLAGGLAERGIGTVLAVLGPAPSDAQRAEALAIPDLSLIETGLPLDWLAADVEAVLEAGRQIAALAARERVDWVQLNQPSLATGAPFATPVVAVAHSCLLTWWRAVEGGEPPADFAWRAGLHRRGLLAADAVVCPSEAFADATRRAYDLPTRPIAVPNGRAALSLPDAAVQESVLTVGRLWDRAKDVSTLDRAAARLAVPVVAAGATTGPNGEQAGASSLHLLGEVGADALADRLASRPVFVSTARYEPFGLAVLEAAAAGCALVLSDIPTFRELWDGAATFVAPGDDQALAAAIEALIGDPERRLAQGERAKAAAQRSTVEAMAARMAALYAGLLPATRAAA